jgi:DNA-binding NtrC family response regulator
MLGRAAEGDATVLLEGETGTGKEVLAESLHASSARSAGPFIVVDCGAIPRELLESELFGHEKGAFTGAHAARVGAFEAASGGTLFLDEIGELSVDLQPKLLRVLEKREVKRVGGNKYEKVDVRVVGATHRNLRGEVNEKRFRADLYYRLAVIQMRVPPLRERIDDLPLLVEHLLGAMRAMLHPHAAMLRSPEFLADLARHGWPGNVRELRNYLERCLALSQKAPLLDDAHEPEPFRVTASMTLEEVRAELARMEGQYLRELVGHHDGNIAAAARAAGVDRAHLYRMLWRHGLR